MAQDSRKPPKLQLQMDEGLAQGTYANLVLVNHSENEFVLDFAFLQPNAPRAKVHARIISSPRHTVRLLRALEHNIRRYEERFGSIELSELSDLPPGLAARHASGLGAADAVPGADDSDDPDEGPDEPPIH